jgi:hypothetical protein
MDDGNDWLLPGDQMFGHDTKDDGGNQSEGSYQTHKGEDVNPLG